MQPRLIKALLSLSGTTTQAKALADQVLSENSSEIVKSLHKRITELEAQISEMATMMSEPETINDEELAILNQVFTQRFSTTDAVELQQCGRNYLRQFAPYVRLVIAAILKNRAVELKVEPLEVWLDVIAANGELK